MSILDRISEAIRKHHSLTFYDWHASCSITCMEPLDTTNLLSSIRTLSELMKLMDDVQQAISLLVAVIRDAQEAALAGRLDFDLDEEEDDSVAELPVAIGTVVAECLAEVEEARAKYLRLGS